ncbi:L,D-transpeptidase catalytic domain [Rhizobiales bacterium GAS113]|jgi:lipoprotein-anchoring transpeptidase ErfK/SrfK|nr:L,D-transpeptidase catalytic domain [Rhizobiales bacterium GAS113]
MTRLHRLYLLSALVLGAWSAAAPAEAARLELVGGSYAPGMIVIRTHERRLLLTLGNGAAVAYPVAVGKPGKQWRGFARVDGKYVRPAWSPPDEVKRDKPWMPAVIPPGPHNPMGERALTLDRGEYAIHGTNMPSSIGKFASYGCIRMFNSDIIDLYERVSVGTLVLVEP